VRVVAGSARGRRLVAPAGEAVRPTTDRVREATFNALGSLGVVRDADVLDLFAGSGAMGIEALSRGAHRATFVDRSGPALAVVRANLATCGLAERADLVRSDWRAAIGSGRWDLAVCDPPYDFTQWEELLGLLHAEVVVVESGHAVDVPSGWSEVRRRAYGATVVAILRRTAPPCHDRDVPVAEQTPDREAPDPEDPDREASS